MIEQGIYTDIAIEDYHNDKEYLSASSLKLAKRSLKLFDMWRQGLVDTTGKEEREKKTCFDFGNAFELALLDKDNFHDKVRIYDPEDRPDLSKGPGAQVNRKWKADFFDTNHYVINKTGKESFETVTKMLEACYQDVEIQKLIKNISYQSSIFWQDPQTGLKLKTRPDICKINKNVIVDVKTAVDGSPEKFSRDLVNFDYPFQAAMQIDGVLKSGYMQSVDFYYWLVVEKEPPYSATLYEFDPEDMKWVLDEYEYVINCVNRAMKEEKYPSYSYRADNRFGILRANIPMYYKNYGL